MASCDWFRMTWTSKNLMWKFNCGTCVPKLTFTYGNNTSTMQINTHQWNGVAISFIDNTLSGLQ
jgi:hypothetical protein